MTLVSNSDLNGDDVDRVDDDPTAAEDLDGGEHDDGTDNDAAAHDDGTDNDAAANDDGTDNDAAANDEGALVDEESLDQEALDERTPDETESFEIDPDRAAVGAVVGDAGGRPWRGQDVSEIVRKALVVLVLLPAVGYGLGMLRGESYTSRSEFVYSLDGSVPDGFLREDRRLLTQMVTFTSDAVLAPVADEYGLEVEMLRAKIDVGTVDMSEVLRLEVSDDDPNRAMELNRAVLDQHQRTLTSEGDSGFNRELIERRTDIADELDAAVAAGAVEQAELAILAAREQQLERRITLLGNRLDRLRTLEDEALAGTSSVAPAAVAVELEEAVTELAETEAELSEVQVEQAEVEARIGAGSSVQRTIDRLEADLTAVDAELSRRDLAPVVESAFRELSEPTLRVRSTHTAGLQGLAVGMLLALPIAAYVGYRIRRRQLWLG